jgi:hypothetical protein
VTGWQAESRGHWRQIADDIVVMPFPFRVLGIDFKRNVTLLRLDDGRVAIHSTAPFSHADVQTIRHFGDPAWLVEATLLHDTFAKKGRAAFSEMPYLAPAGFTRVSGVAAQPIGPGPSDWVGEIDVLRIEGTKKGEHAFFHRRSRTLVVADLFFSFVPQTKGWPRFFARWVMGLPPSLFGVSRFFRFLISDQDAFRRSMMDMLEWDFERVVVGHAEPLTTNAHEMVSEALRKVTSESEVRSQRSDEFRIVD